MTCYTFSVRPTIPESRNVKVAMKKFDEEENEDYLNFEVLSFGEEKIFWKNFCGRWCIFYQTKNRFSENFCKLLRLKILKIVVFDQFFNQFFRTKRVVTFDALI